MQVTLLLYAREYLMLCTSRIRNCACVSRNKSNGLFTRYTENTVLVSDEKKNIIDMCIGWGRMKYDTSNSHVSIRVLYSCIAKTLMRRWSTELYSHVKQKLCDVSQVEQWVFGNFPAKEFRSTLRQHCLKSRASNAVWKTILDLIHIFTGNYFSP